MLISTHVFVCNLPVFSGNKTLDFRTQNYSAHKHNLAVFFTNTTVFGKSKMFKTQRKGVFWLAAHKS